MSYLTLKTKHVNSDLEKMDLLSRLWGVVTRISAYTVYAKFDEGKMLSLRWGNQGKNEAWFKKSGA